MQKHSDGLQDKVGDINVEEKLTCSALSTPSVFAASCWPSSSRASPTRSSCDRRWAACAKWWRATCSGSQVGGPPPSTTQPHLTRVSQREVTVVSVCSRPADCRDVLLPLVTDQLSGQLDDHSSKPDHEACAHLLSTMLDNLDRKDVVRDGSVG